MIRPYQRDDRSALLQMLQHHIPRYFAPSEKSDFEEYLDRHLEEYYVVEENGMIIGAGGINYQIGSGQARISWDMIHPDHQGKGIGKKLTRFRLDQIMKRPEIEQVVVRTSQLAYQFYQKSGFELEKIEKDFWADGFDLYQMRLVLKPI